MRISDKKLFEAIMAGKAVRRTGWEEMLSNWENTQVCKNM